jgi:hypothetical protein
MGKHRWKGNLAKPIYVGTIAGIEATKGWVKSWPDGKRMRADQWSRAVIWNELIQKLDLLRKHYRIKNKEDFFSLALRLAMDCHPGFQVVDDAPLKFRRGRNWGGVIHASKGRPLKWTPKQIVEFRRTVEATKKKHRFQTDRAALEHIIQTCPEWYRPPDRSLEGWRKTLQNRLAANPEK